MTGEKPYSARAFLAPKLRTLIQQGIEAGFPCDVQIAVLIDLLDDSNLEDMETQ